MNRAEANVMSKPTGDGPTSPAEGARMGASDADKDMIGRNLRKLFSTVEEEPIPDRFQDLLRKLAEEEAKK